MMESAMKKLEMHLNRDANVSQARVLQLTTRAVVAVSLVGEAKATAKSQRCAVDAIRRRMSQQKIMTASEMPKIWILFSSAATATSTAGVAGPIYGPTSSDMITDEAVHEAVSTHKSTERLRNGKGHKETSETSIEDYVWAVIADTLRVAPPTARRAASFTSIGGTARAAVQIQTRCWAEKRIVISAIDILGGSREEKRRLDEVVATEAYVLLTHTAAASGHDDNDDDDGDEETILEDTGDKVEPDEETALKYWQEQYDNGDGTSPMTFPPSAPDTTEHQIVESEVTTVRVSEKQNQCAEGCLLLRAAWAIILGRYNDGRNVVGFDTLSLSGSRSDSFASGSSDDETSYDTAMPMRVELHNDMTASQMLVQISRNLRDASLYARFKERFMMSLYPEARKAAASQFTSALVVEIDPKTSITTKITTKLMARHYSLVLHAQIRRLEINLRLAYDTSIISEVQGTALLNQLKHVTAQLFVLSRDARLLSISVAGPWDLHQATVWNGARKPAYHYCLHNMISDTAARQPDDEAICAVDSSTTYAALEEEADMVARHIVGLGVAPQTVVPLCFAASKWAIVSMLGILKAGCIFMPLDPSHPESRIRALVGQVDADVVIASRGAAEICRRVCSRVIILDDHFIVEKLLLQQQEEGEQQKHIALPVCSPADAAYVLFTSGSTGTPKGVLVEHSAACSSAIAFGNRTGQDTSTRMLSFASYAFDACIHEIFVPLVVGGTVCVAPPESKSQDISPFLTKARVTAAILTPSYAKTLDPRKLPALDTLMLAGEAATPDVVHAWQGRVRRLINGYGPTEACVCVLSYDYDPNLRYDPATTIGTPVHGNCWIVEPDDHDRLTPIGCTGELLVQSHALARGYFAAPEKTAASFVSGLGFFPPETSMRAGRCYKTGDLVRYNADGTFEYQGRKDGQIKLRGQRLEPGEIEHGIGLADARIQSTAVHLTKRKAGSSLVAFFDFKERPEGVEWEDIQPGMVMPSSTALQDFLAQLRIEVSSRLPPFMTPSFFVPLNQIPFVTSMKMDRKKLQNMADSIPMEILFEYAALASSSSSSSLPSLSAAKNAPMSPSEIKMRDLWAKILDMDAASIGRDASFLHIGGDSISAIQLSTAAREQGLAISTADLFRDGRLFVVARAAKSLESETVDRSPDRQEIRPFSMLKTDDLNQTLARLRRSCHLLDGETIDDAYPCTPLQEGLLALGVKHPGSYVAKLVYQLHDDVDIDRFKTAWEYICHTRENQRVRIVKLGRDSIQTLVRDDFTWEPTPEGMSLREFLAVAQNMNMSYGRKLSRSALIREEGSGKRYFVWVTHHAVFDGWTVMLTLEALRELYQNGITTTSTSLTFTPYANFVKYATSGLDMARASAYWRQQLLGAQPPTFPMRRWQQQQTKAEPSSKTVTEIITHDIPFPVSARKRLSGITGGTVLRAAWALVLARHGNTPHDICFGATASGRNADVEGIARMTGPVIGTVPVRVRIDADQTVRSFLSSVQHQAVEMLPYEQFGFQNITKISAETKAAADVTSLLIVQPAQQVEAMATSVAALMRSVDDECSVMGTMEGYFTFPIVLQCPMHEDHVSLHFTYDSSVVSRSRMEAICHHFESVTGQLLKYGGGSDGLEDSFQVGDITLTSDWDLDRAISFNKDVKEVVSDTCLHDLISQRAAAANPEHEAVYSSSTCLTYSELERQSSLLACHLRQLGVTLETIVPICFDKSAATIVAMLGIMKAGGAFMPMDPADPYHRRKALMEQVGGRWVMTSAESASSCDGIAQDVIVLSPAFMSELAGTTDVTAAAPFPSVPSSAAYILFTSGSTGQPKGIVVEHTAICSSIISHGREFGLGTSSRVLQFASYVFDVSVSEILTTLVHGGTVCVPSGTERMQDIAGFINRARADVAMLTPSFVATFGPHDVPGLRVLVLGGEAPTKATLSTWQPHVRLLNGYAPAECCIYALTHTYQSTLEVPTLLGKGIHVRCWIVEPENHDRLAPVGCVGELVIQTNTMGRGYVKDAERTAQVFFNSMSWVPGELHEARHRYYKSGDLVRYDDVNGNIEYLGRKDTQVKLRGQRIELGEVEYTIQQHLTNAKYVTAEVVRRGCRETLVAFISFHDTDNKASEESPIHDSSRRDMVRETTPYLAKLFESATAHLQAKLPPFMVPALFVALRRTPFLSSVKVNRKLLRGLVDDTRTELNVQPSATAESAGKDISPLLLDMEAKLVDMWAEILGVSPEVISPDVSFFQLGGDSISVLQLSSLARTRGVHVSASKMTTNPTLRAMAEDASSCQEDGATTTTTAYVTTPLPFELLETFQADSIARDACQQCNLASQDDIEDIYPCTAFQEGLVALSARQPGAYVSLAVYRLGKGVSTARFRSAWEETVERCSNLRTRVIIPSSSSNGRAFQVLLSCRPEWEDTSCHDVASYVAAAKKRQMAYGDALCRYALMEENQEQQGPYFVLQIHHATYDLWSMHLILSVLRESFDGVEELGLVPYSTFVKYSMQSDVEETKKYWQEQLEGIKSPTFPCPTTGQGQKMRPARRNMQEMKTKVTMTMPTNVARTKPSMTRATLLQAAWSIVFARHSESADVCYGTTVTGRLANLSGITNVIGPTLATVPLRVKIDYAMSVSDFVDEWQTRAAERTPHEQYGLVNISRLSADAKAACDFSSLFIVQPVSQVVAMGETGSLPIIEEDTTDEIVRLLEDGLESYFDQPLVVNCLLSEDGNAEIVAYYDADVVSRESLEAISHHLGRVAEQLAQKSDLPIGALSLVDAWDLERAICSQAVRSPVEVATCTHWLAEKHMEMQPQRPAVSAWDGSLTYRELSVAAAGLASRLRRYGVVSGDLVVTSLRRSKWSVVALLAIQLTGAAIVPVSPATLDKSGRAILDSVQPKLVLTEKESCWATGDAASSGMTTIMVDSDAVSLSTAVVNLAQDGLVSLHPSPETLSLVLLTDMDSDRPNGVKFSHSAVSLNAVAYAEAIHLNQDSRTLQQADVSSYLSIIEMLSTLSAGGCLCIPQEDLDDAAIVEYIQKTGVSAAILTEEVAANIKANQVPMLKTLGFSSEMARNKALLDSWADMANLYTFLGSNETMMVACNKQVSAYSDGQYNKVGESLSASFWVVEDTQPLRPTPLGCIGELVMEGPSVARGYLHQQHSPGTDALIQDVNFLPGNTARRAVRTGELVRRNLDGSFTYVGRKEAGQVDLGSPVDLLQADSASREPPATRTERTLRDIWAEILSMPASDIARTDSFLGLGGDSISAIQLVSMARRQGLGLTIASIFRDARLSEMAASAVISEGGGNSGQDEEDKDSYDAVQAWEPFSLVSGTPSDYTMYEIKKQCGLGQTAVVEDMYPCTRLQEGLMAVSASHGAGGRSYVARHAFRLSDDVDMAAFKAAWERTVEATPVLRTRIVPVQGTFMQIVVREDEAVWEDEEATDVKEYMARDAGLMAMGFGSRLSRYGIVSARYFVWTLHHAVVDGWSMNLVLDRMARLYRRVEVTATRPFAAFIQYTMSLDETASAKFWSEQLQGTVRTSFPPESVEKHGASASVFHTVPYNAGSLLTLAGASSGAETAITMATVLRAAWALVLAAYCDTDDVCFGTAVSGRQAPVGGIEHMAGPTIASVPVRVAIPADGRIGDFLRRLQSQAVAMAAHEQFGLQKMAKLSQDARDACEFSSLMIVQPRAAFGAATAESADGIIQRVEFELAPGTATSRHAFHSYPLVVQFGLGDAEVQIHLQYAPELVSELRATAITRHLQHVVSQLLDSSPDKLMRHISVSGPWDLQQAVSWNQQDQTAVNRCIHELFADHVARDPAREAVYTSSRSLSYAELDRLSTQLAAYLKSIGVGPEIIVSICMEKSHWPTLCALAILKAGGAFMFLDPTHPYEYRETLVKVANANVLLTSADSLAACRGLVEHVIIVSDSLDCFNWDMDASAELLAHDRATPDCAAYVVFTSGSTGVPKGIAIEHRSLLTSQAGQAQHLGICSDTRTLQFSNHVWDVCIFDMFTTLVSGGTVCVPSEHERLHGTAKFVNEARCNTSVLTSSFIRTMDPDQVPGLGTVINGGEAMTKDVLATWVDKVKLFDAYGPAEASCIASIHRYTSSSETAGTIGRPSRNGTWIVDPGHGDRLAPIGCEGELVVQGPAVARGYLGEPSVTRQVFSSTAQFLPEHLVARSSRFYWTGDIVKYNEKGELLYLGRRDAQVKLRGQRLELGHIENQIQAAVDNIETVVVEVIRRGTPAAALVGLVKLKDDAGVEAEEGGLRSSQPLLLENTSSRALSFRSLHAKLTDVLPGYMIPSHLVALSAVPKNRAAKIDRGRLRQAMEQLSSEELRTYLVHDGTRAEFCDVTSETEKKIRDAWAAVLHLDADKISTQDNFYDLGGDSIAIITLLRRIRVEFGVEMGMSMMNSKKTTVAQMARLVAAEPAEESLSAGVDLESEIAAALSAPWASAVQDVPLAHTCKTLPARISVFLTGGTGFLGTQILRRLLDMDSVERVVALVRANSPERGLERLRETGRVAGWWNGAAAEEKSRRIEVWTGDLNMEKLGLSEEQWAQLSGTCDDAAGINAVIHNGATVNWNADYEKLRAANVGSVVSLLRAATESPRAPRFVFVSGGVPVAADADPVAVASMLRRSTGYVQTKYVAESVVRNLARRQQRFSVVRPGMVIGTVAEGVANVDDFLWRFVAAAVRIGLYPDDDGFVPVCEAGRVAAQTVSQMMGGDDGSSVDGSWAGLPARTFWARVNEALEGGKCDATSMAEWRTRALRDVEETGEGHPLWPVQHFVAVGGISGKAVVREGEEEDEEERELGMAVAANVRYLRRVGFIGREQLPMVEGVLRRR